MGVNVFNINHSCHDKNILYVAFPVTKTLDDGATAYRLATHLLMAKTPAKVVTKGREGSFTWQEPCEGRHNQIGDESSIGEKACVGHKLVV